MEELKKMPKTTLMLIGFLGALTLALLFLAIYVKRPASIPEQAVKDKPVNSFALTTLKLENPALSSSPSGLFETPLTIDTGKNKITAVQIELSYNPKALKNVNIEPGSFIPNAVVLLKKVDQQNGKISFALALPLGQKGIQGQGELAKISFEAGEKIQTSINFLPKTQVTAEGISQSVLKSTVGNLFVASKSSN